MTILRASKSHECHKCKKLILTGDFYFNGKKGKRYCLECGRTKKPTVKDKLKKFWRKLC